MASGLRSVCTLARIRRHLGWALLLLMALACLLTAPYTFGGSDGPSRGARYERGALEESLLPPLWAPHAADEAARLDAARESTGRAARHFLGTDRLGRDLLVRCLAGGGISIGIGITAAIIAVVIGTLYGSIAASAGGRVDALMMRSVDVLYGLPYVLLVVLIAVAAEGVLERVSHTAGANGSDGGWLGFLAANRELTNVLTLLLAIGGVSWLTMARVIRGQVLSLRSQPFMEAARTAGIGWRRQFVRYLLPNLLGPIVVYGALAVPAAMLSESFLSFLGIGVREPLPSWGNLAADGLNELNTVRSRWWLLLWPCLFIAITLLALNFVGESLRQRLDPRDQPSRTSLRV